MTTWMQNPTDAAFGQNPYPAYETARAMGPVLDWPAYGMKAVFSHAMVTAIQKDKRFGRAPVAPAQIPEHLEPFYALEHNSMLELEPPRHTRLRKLVLRAFTSRRIANLAPDIETLCDSLIDQFPDRGEVDLIAQYAAPIPVIVIARLLGVPQDMAPQLLRWSNDMVGMYQARRDRAMEEAAAAASTDFANFMRNYIDARRSTPADDLITELIAAEEDGETLSTDEMISTCILLLNAGHEATVHTMGNGIKTLLERRTNPMWLAQDRIDGTVEEILRYDPPLHVFTRYCYEEVRMGRTVFQRGDEIALMLAAANRDPNMWEDPEQFNPARALKTNTSFGGGIHFCVGAPLARLELKIALPRLFARLPHMRLAQPARYADLYHFHGLERLMITAR